MGYRIIIMNINIWSHHIKHILQDIKIFFSKYIYLILNTTTHQDQQLQHQHQVQDLFQYIRHTHMHHQDLFQSIQQSTVILASISFQDHHFKIKTYFKFTINNYVYCKKVLI